MNELSTLKAQLEKINQQMEQLDAERALLVDKLNLLLNLHTGAGDTVQPSLGRQVVIVGGNGELGRLFHQHFSRSGYAVSIIEKDDWADSAELLSCANLVMVAVPIHCTIEVIEKLSSLPKDCLLVDLTSVKTAPLNAMLDTHPGPVLGLHPMFGPNVTALNQQLIIYCHGRSAASYQWLLDQFAAWGCQLKQVTTAEHDKYMQLIQALRHFTSFAYGSHLRHENFELTKLVEFSSPIYHLELMMVGRLFGQNAELYADIITASPENIRMIERFAEHFINSIKLIKQPDQQAFIKEFGKTTQWFGRYCATFLAESEQLLQQKNPHQ